ncbi:MAG: argininosuccinate synthase [Vicinamibacterales bacterium]
MNRIVLAYSGSLDGSAAISWLTEQYGAQVATVSLDVGQGRRLEDVRDRALALGAVRAHVIDARDEFASGFILPALQAGALYEGRYPLATALSLPLVARRLVEVGRIEKADAIAHGSRHANDSVRIETAARALEPGVRILAPAREWGMTRDQVLAYAKVRGIPLPAADSHYSIDMNLWGRSIEFGDIEDPWREPPEEIYELTKSPLEAPDTPAYVEIGFEQGVPVSINGVAMAPVELIQSLETIAGAHAVGRIDMVENWMVGIKSREVYEAPSAVVLHLAHRELQSLVAPRDLERLTHDLSVRYADLVYNGLWYTPTREAIDGLVATVQKRVTGTVRLKFFKGDCRAVGRKSPYALHAPPPRDGVSQDPSAAEGYMRNWGLPLETATRLASQIDPLDHD